MSLRKISFLFPILLGAVILAAGWMLMFPAIRAGAQCGSQASSCKNCHEVQGQDLVNNDGSGWHQSHAFGDFCYICHAGNSQSTDEALAHTGMVPPLSDTQAACQSCHPNDLQARVKVYADALGVEAGTGGNGTAVPTPAAAPVVQSTPEQVQPAALQEASLSPGDPNLVDYVQLYNENVLGKKATNTGNAVLIILIGALVIGGGAFVVHNEGLVSISFKETKPVEGEYPTDVVDMLPDLARLKPNARKSLRRLLEKPGATAELLGSIERLMENGSMGDKV